jgi:precorrin-2 dehydrogenase/sirohydrochlorin ferrochelatase
MALYPINLNISGQLCVVIGGGAVATRKISSLLACEARVRVVSPQLSAGIRHLIERDRIKWIQRTYKTGDLQGAILAFALTDNPEVQSQIAVEAKESGIPINIGDNPAASTFHTAAPIRRGDLLISISTGGGSPALAGAIRQELEQHYGPEYCELVKLLGEVRKIHQGQSSPQKHHKILVEKILQTDILALLRNKDWQELQVLLCEILPQNMDANDIVQKVRGY